MDIHEFKPKEKYIDNVEDTDESDEDINDIAADDDDVINIVDQVFREAAIQRATFNQIAPTIAQLDLASPQLASVADQPSDNLEQCPYVNCRKWFKKRGIKIHMRSCPEKNNNILH